MLKNQVNFLNYLKKLHQHILCLKNTLGKIRKLFKCFFIMIEIQEWHMENMFQQ
jgi:hypothetical protein